MGLTLNPNKTVLMENYSTKRKIPHGEFTISPFPQQNFSQQTQKLSRKAMEKL